MDKRIQLKLNAGRSVSGVVRGFYPFMNVVLEEAVEVCKGNTKNTIGKAVIRGNSIVMVEAVERV
ncbi:probable small nuclear ribonucleoprotein G [Drosophila subobscura]|uniref:probable small nuclear ribonucleoprotein G n=1 Tax=Drosophila subobscura TaxID=7241 RepID=UPI00155AFB33|nr:probable small nuclear ribonucleoprotein G [Drosophila subobscura]